MSRVLVTLLYFTNIYTSIICHIKCKEYIIIINEVSCTNGSTTWEPIKLQDVEWDHDECTADSSEILSYDENYSNESYIVKFDYADSESICIPILKSTKLLDNIEILEDNTVESENTSKSSEISRTSDEKKDIDMKTSMLECLISNYTYACDKKNINAIDIDLIYANESTVKSLDSIVPKKGDLVMFKECVFTRNFCVNRHPLLNISIFDEFIKSNHSIVKTIVALFNNGNGTIPVALNTSSNNFTNWNCIDISNNVTNMYKDQLTSLTHSILTKYACLNVSDTNITPTYNIKVYTPMDFTVTDTKVQYINCEENFKIVNNNALGIYCNTVDIPVLKYISTSTTTESNNISSTDIPLLKSDLNCTLIWHCNLDNIKTSKENYSEAVDIIAKYKVLNFQNCTEDCKIIHKYEYRNDSKVIMISKKEPGTFKDLEPLMGSESIILNFIPNLSDSEETISFNVTKGRIISLYSDDKESEFLNRPHSTILKLVISNCVKKYTKALNSAASPEIDIIFCNENNTNLNSFITNELKNTLSNSTERAILSCVYSDKTMNEDNSVMECKFIESNKSKSTTREPYTNYHNYSVSTEKAKLKDDITTTTTSEKDINVPTEMTVTTSAKLKESETITTNEKTIMETTEIPKENKPTIKQDTTIVPNGTTESNTMGSGQELQKYEEMNYVSPAVYGVAIAAFITVVTSVSTYAYCLFKRKRQNDYQIACTRDWKAMDESHF